MSRNEAVDYWISSALEDWKISQTLYSGNKFNYALFFLQLTIEKLIKATHVFKHDEHPLYIHNLVLLAQKAGLKFDEAMMEDLKEISSFNVSARYDSYKRDFYQKSTAEFAKKWMDKGQAIRKKLLWMLSH